MKQHCMGQKHTGRDLTHKSSPMVNTTTPVPVPAPSQSLITEGKSAVPLFPQKYPRRRNGNLRNKSFSSPGSCLLALVVQGDIAVENSLGRFFKLYRHCSNWKLPPTPSKLRGAQPTQHNPPRDVFPTALVPEPHSIPSKWTQISRWDTGTETLPTRFQSTPVLKDLLVYGGAKATICAHSVLGAVLPSHLTVRSHGQVCYRKMPDGSRPSRTTGWAAQWGKIWRWNFPDSTGQTDRGLPVLLCPTHLMATNLASLGIRVWLQFQNKPHPPGPDPKLSTCIQPPGGPESRRNKSILSWWGLWSSRTLLPWPAPAMGRGSGQRQIPGFCSVRYKGERNRDTCKNTAKTLRSQF